ncbi:tyrosine-type recombinase/integrase [Nocardioides humi]|nr:tyrosine-type recombinase/integrase [Nocardioides humi]
MPDRRRAEHSTLTPEQRRARSRKAALKRGADRAPRPPERSPSTRRPTGHSAITSRAVARAHNGTPVADAFGLADSWSFTLTAERKSPRTIEAYMLTVDLFARWMLTQGHAVDDVRDVTPELVRGWFAHLAATRSAETCRTRYVALRQFVKWCLAEGEFSHNPMANIVQPTSVPKTTAPLATADLAKLINDCAGRDFASVRDRAIFMTFADTGARLSGVADMRVSQLDLRERTGCVILKGGRELTVPFGVKTAAALDRYIRARRRMAYEGMDWLWLSSTNKGRLTKNGIYQMMRRRADRLGIYLHPHLFRHSFAHVWLEGGGTEGDLMALLGWSSRQMVDRYAAATRAQRARKAYQSRAPMDTL